MDNKTKQTRNQGLFSKFATVTADALGNIWVFITALLLIIVWLLTGHLFKYSDTWQLFMNTLTNIITFLMVFLIQHTQNRDTKIINLKIDELIKALRSANNTSIDFSELSDKELKHLEKEYKKLRGKTTGE